MSLNLEEEIRQLVRQCHRLEPNSHLLNAEQRWQLVAQAVQKFYGQHAPRARHSIELCGQCSGSGVVLCSELADYHRREYDTWTETCRDCAGTGRLAVEVYEFRQPLAPEQPRDRT